jgi:hypothetical protein
MRFRAMLFCLATLALPAVVGAQATLLVDPAKVPMALKGGWIHPEPKVG